MCLNPVEPQKAQKIQAPLRGAISEQQTSASALSGARAVWIIAPGTTAQHAGLCVRRITIALLLTAIKSRLPV